jgi:predicted ATP-dependent serine protease
LLVVDSLNVLALCDVKADVGSTTQMKAVTTWLTTFGKRTRIAILLVVHVNKDDELSGPRTLEHLCDGVVRFDPLEAYPEARDPKGNMVEDSADIRVLSSTGKMRNGPSHVHAFLQMTPEGLRPPTKPVSTLVMT